MRTTLLCTLSLLVGATSLAAQGGGVRVGPPQRAAAGGQTWVFDSSTFSGRGARIQIDTSRVVYSLSANRARIGVSISLAATSNDPIGAVVEAITPKGPADKAGIKAGDIIMKVNDVSIGNSAAAGSGSEVSSVGTKLVTTISALKPGVPATLQVRRGTETITVKVTPEKDDSQFTTTVISRGFADLQPGSVANGGFFVDGMSSLNQNLRRFSVDSSRRIYGDSLQARAQRQVETSLTIRADGANHLGAMTLRTSFDALSRLELAPINPELGSYFGATEGVLVLSVAPSEMATSSGGRARAAQVATRTSSGTTTTTVPKTATTAPTQKTQPADAAKATTPTSELLDLKPGDVITAVDGRKVATPADLMRILRSYQQNDEVKLTILRNRKNTTISTKMPAE